VPEKIRLTAQTLKRKQKSIANLLQYMRDGSAPKSVMAALTQDEQEEARLSQELESLEKTKDEVFAPPPEGWVRSKLTELRTLLAAQTVEAAQALRRYFGEITLTPRVPEVGQPYFEVKTKVKTFALFDEPVKKGGSSNNGGGAEGDGNKINFDADPQEIAEDQKIRAASGSNSDKWWTLIEEQIGAVFCRSAQVRYASLTFLARYLTKTSS
jgi:hypothetical protein